MKRILSLMLLFLTVLQVRGQDRLLSGRVIDKTSKTPVAGASVAVIGTDKTTVTDASGDFTIAANAGQTLRIVYIGYVAHMLKVPSGDAKLQVELSEDSQSLDEIVVTGYQQERKKDLTGAVTVVDIDDIKQAAANPIKSLQGMVPGMYITSNGSPRGAATVRIRGIGTLNNNDPLYIIDGVPSKAALHTINPADIESMQVLKDASAASIYGSRAANGVIIITTKKGVKGGTKLNVNAYTALSGYTSKISMLDTEGFGRALWQANINNGTNPNSTSMPYQFESHIDAQTGQAVLDKIITPEYLDAAKTLKASNTDWFDEISQTGVVQNYDLSVSNASDNGSYLLGLGYFENKGVIKHKGFNRISARLNSDYKLLNSNLVIGQNLSIVYLDEVGNPTISEAVQALPIIPVRTVDGKGWGGPVTGMNDRQNPMRLLDNNKQNNNEYVRLFGSFFADLTLFKGLKFRSNIGFDYGNSQERASRLRYQSGYLSNPVNRLQSTQWHSLKTTWTNTLNYNYYSGKHRLDALAGTEYFVDNYTSFWASREDFIIEDDEFLYLNSGTGIKDNSGSGTKSVLMSYFAKVNYSFMDRYLISGTLRYDGSSRFGANNRFAAFPAVSAGWRISEEAFMKNKLSFVDDLKLRIGWGITGNQEIDDNAIYNIYLADYNLTSYDISGKKTGVLPSGYRQSQIGNPDLKWESTMMTNLGLDFSFLNQKLYGSAEYYIKKTTDILVAPGYIAVLGEGGRQWFNAPSMRNVGFELSLGHQTKIGKDLKIDVNANLDVVRNKVTYLPSSVINNYGGNGGTDNILGRTIGSLYGYIADGLFKTQEEVTQHATQPGKGLGRIRYRDVNGDGVVTDADRTWLGVPLPDFSYGFNFSASYKAFDVSFFLQGISGLSVENGVKTMTDFWSTSNTGSNKGSRLLDAWSPLNPTSNIPAIALTDANFESRFSTYFVEDGSYLKLRNAQIGYTMNAAPVRKLGIQSLRFYLGGDNLGLLLKSKSFTGLDPENPAYGYPNPLVVTAGINLKL